MATRNPKEDKDPKEGNPGGNPGGESGGTKFPAYLEAAMRISTAFPLGAARQDTEVVKIGSETVDIRDATPGICVLDYIPTYGVSRDASSALNRASFYEFNEIRREISGNRPYETVDHIIYRACINALRDLYSYIARAYETLSTFNATNLYRPRDVFRAMDLDYDDWSRNAANVFQWLVNHASALAPFPVVPIGKISDRHNAYNRYYYKDGDEPQAQTYIFNQKAFYSYELVDQVKGISLDIAEDGTFKAYCDLWDRMYAALQSSSDVYIIAADIRRAFADKAVTQLTPPTVDGSAEYVILDNVLTSVMNASIIAFGGVDSPASVAQLDGFRIYDGGNGMVLCTPSWTWEQRFGPAFENVVCCLPGNLRHLNFAEQEPDTSKIRPAVRFHPVISSKVEFEVIDSYDYNLKNTVNVEACGTEVIVGARFIQRKPDGSGINKLNFATVMYAVRGTDAANQISRMLAQRSVFDWAPPVVIALGGNMETNPVGDSLLVEDLQNYVPVSDVVMSNIHNANLLYEFGFPE